MFGRSTLKPNGGAASPLAQTPSPPPQAKPVVPPQLMPDEEVSGRLSAYNFIDMYISSDPLAPIMAHGLRSAAIGLTTFGKGLVQIPKPLYDDALKLFSVIERKWRNSGFKREFTVTYDERSYRCALIAPPDFSFQQDQEVKPGNMIQWCIRQVSMDTPSFSDLNLPVDAQASFEELLVRRGLVICSGPFASGKTTLASTVLDYWVRESRDIGITLEDPPEIPLARVTEDRGVIYQIDLLDRSVREAIKHARRWSPRYVLLGEVRTSDVAGELLHMAISGPLVICTIHASDPVQAIMSLFRFASSAMSEDMAKDMIAASLLHVFHQNIIGGRILMQHAKIFGDENHLIRAKIKSGNFKGIYEDIERQVINRNAGRR